VLRVAGVDAANIGQGDEQVSIDPDRRRRREHVVVTDPDLLGRDRVVLVDDRNDAPLEQRLDRVPEVREPLRVLEVVLGQQ